MLRRFAALLLAAAMLLNMTACSKNGDTFRYDFGVPVTNLDPQFTTQEEAKTVLANCMEGLLRQSGSGEIQLAAAQSMELSENGKTYTFTLREGMEWSDGTPLTAQDFVFGFQRLFGAEARSPYTEDFMTIRNAQAVLEGSLPVEKLGVKAKNDLTLVITLEQANPFFELALATSAALPCNRDFFLSTRGRYGLEKNAMLFNGPFAITTWNEEKVVMYAREGYAGQPVLPEAVVFYSGREEPFDLLLSGKADAGVVAEENLTQVAEKGLNYSAYDNAVWCLTFNQQRQPLDNVDIRQALQMTLDRSQIAAALEENSPVTNSMIPPAILAESGQSYREAAGEVLEPVYTPEAGRALFQAALQQLEQKDLKVTMLLPQGEEYLHCAGVIQQLWQQNLSIYLNLEVLPQEE
ncbi:MAG: peptide ABC transporter substrate-binding protein, partial [Oscillospiraceae bacterium]|nr:peptide ABC transporter substrate-binding protein [Oscillospiraceae bacterium]